MRGTSIAIAAVSAMAAITTLFFEGTISNPSKYIRYWAFENALQFNRLFHLYPLHGGVQPLVTMPCFVLEWR